MILIFKENKDESIRKIVAWLKILKINFILVNEEDAIDIVDLIYFNENSIDINKDK
jgi:hypothetical protein